MEKLRERDGDGIDGGREREKKEIDSEREIDNILRKRDRERIDWARESGHILKKRNRQRKRGRIDWKKEREREKERKREREREITDCEIKRGN